jgi:parvulin-like peptidyl-prolyl isomerase
VGAKSGQKKKTRGKQRPALIIFAAVFVLLFVGFAVAQGIGAPSVPSGDVATVEGVPDDVADVSEAEFDRALAQQIAQAGLKKPPKPGETKYEELKATALGELLDSIWLQGEAEELGVSVTDKQVATQLATIKKQNFPTPAAYKKFLKESQFTQEDVNDRIKLQLLSEQVQELISSLAPPPSSAEIAGYYESEKASKFSSPASRTIRVIVNEEKSKVDKAKAELEKDNSPASWKKVAPKYSSDPTTNKKGGLQPGITEEFVKGPLKEAIFDSATNELIGPVKYEKSYLLIEVVKLQAEEVKSLPEVRTQIVEALAQEQKQEFFSEFVTEYQAKWQSRTICADDFLVESRCSNFVGSGHPSTAPPACYEADPQGGLPAECPAPVLQNQPALPGTVTVIKPKGEPFPQRPRPESTQPTGEEAATPEEGAESGATGAEGSGE